MATADPEADLAAELRAELRAIYAAKFRADLRAKVARLALAKSGGAAFPFFAWSPELEAGTESANAEYSAARLERAAALAASAHPRVDSVSTAGVSIAITVESLPALQVFPEARAQEEAQEARTAESLLHGQLHRAK